MTGGPRPARWPPGRRGLHALVAALAALLLAGCVSVPGDGPVVAGRKVDETTEPAVDFLPPGPTPGASPSGLVRGFLLASTAFTGDHEKAREYLQEPPGPRVRWRPDSSVAIYPFGGLRLSWTRHGVTHVEPSRTASARTSTSPPASASGSGPTTPATATRTGTTEAPSPGAPGAIAADDPPALGETVTVTVTVQVQARINDAGEYTISPPNDVETRTFALTGTREGWRISSLADGILIAKSDFRYAFKDLPLYWSDPLGKYLVPDVRWFPSQESATTPAAMVSALLGSCCADRKGAWAPAVWLRAGVVTGAPEKTKPTVNGVKVVDGVATVDLTKPAREANAVQRLMLKNQLERTLSGPDQTAVAVSSVNVTVEQQVFEMQVSPSPTSDAQGSAPGPAGPQPPPDVDGPLVGLDAKGAIVRLDGGKAVPVKGLAVPASPTNTSPATETGGGAYAVLVDGRKRLVYAVPSGPTTTLVRGNGLLPPSFDPFGWVWTAQEQAGDVVIAALPGSGVSWVQASWLGGARLRSLRISPEGARAVLVAQRPAGATQVFVCSVVRDGKGRPIALGPPHLLLAGEQQVISAAWAGDTHVAVLVHGSGQLVQPWVVELGGDAEQATEVEGVAWISAGHGPQDLYATTATGAVRMLTAAGWQDVAGIRWASLPG